MVVPLDAVDVAAVAVVVVEVGFILFIGNPPAVCAWLGVAGDKIAPFTAACILCDVFEMFDMLIWVVFRFQVVLVIAAVVVVVVLVIAAVVVVAVLPVVAVVLVAVAAAARWVPGVVPRLSLYVLGNASNA